MLEKPIVLVIGAGASCDFGFPAGDTLAKRIREDLSFEVDLEVTRGERLILDAYRAKNADVQPFIDGARKIATALPSFKSIDDCLHTHQHNKLGVLAGKMAIAHEISKAEAASVVARLGDRSPRVSDLAHDEVLGRWPGALMRILVTGRRRADYARIFEDLIIVSFNYDRCIQSILSHLLQRALDITPAEATEAMKGLRVYHPYGSLGPLQLDGSPGVSFGASGLDLLQASERLFVYTEERDMPDAIAAMKGDVYDAQRLVFLGYGFHKQNIELLASPDRELRGKEMLGTVYREPTAAVEKYHSLLGSLVGIGGRWQVEDTDCAGFMARHGAVLG